MYDYLHPNPKRMFKKQEEGEMQFWVATTLDQTTPFIEIISRHPYFYFYYMWQPYVHEVARVIWS